MISIFCSGEKYCTELGHLLHELSIAIVTNVKGVEIESQTRSCWFRPIEDDEDSAYSILEIRAGWIHLPPCEQRLRVLDVTAMSLQMHTAKSSQRHRAHGDTELTNTT
jgi:hypothetical protein